MNLQVEKKSNNFFYISCGLIVLITTVILGVFHLVWWYYLVGVVLGFISHVLMVIQTKRFIRIQNDKYEKAVFAPKKDAVLWIFIRILVIALVLFGVVFLTHLYLNDRLIESIILMLSGYTTIKGVFIITIFIFKEGR